MSNQTLFHLLVALSSTVTVRSKKALRRQLQKFVGTLIESTESSSLEVLSDSDFEKCTCLSQIIPLVFVLQKDNTTLLFQLNA
jgi:hypothetical protein